jgi:1-deoxy-D-xylulose-5-phosphate reductoisomerase
MKRIAILGSTGSIGQNALEVIRSFPGKFSVGALSTNSNTDILYRQIKEFHPAVACVYDPLAAAELRGRLSSRATRVLVGEAGLREMAGDKKIDTIVLAIGGAGALGPLLEAIENGKDIALANKEALVMAGSIIMKKARVKGARILPIDSEQSAIWQCLDGEDKAKLKNIYLTASGGPFISKSIQELKNISVADTLRHPRWKMGKKITVDSATLMNKGLEILEAMHLFGVTSDRIKVLVHPEAIIHSMVEFIDGVILAQLSVTDMRIPIQYALSYPERLPAEFGGVDFLKLKELKFYKPDFKKFPCLELAFEAARQMGTLPAVLNAADEVGVDYFLKGQIDFLSIPKVIAGVMRRHKNIREPELKDILEADSWARQEARQAIACAGHN